MKDLSKFHGDLRDLLALFLGQIANAEKLKTFEACTRLCSGTRTCCDRIEDAFGVSPDCDLKLIKEFISALNKARSVIDSSAPGKSPAEVSHIERMSANVALRSEELELYLRPNIWDAKQHPLGSRFDDMTHIGERMSSAQHAIKEKRVKGKVAMVGP